MHMFSREKNFYGGHGIVGAQVPLGTGLAFANKYKRQRRRLPCLFRRRRANQGQVYESFNMAELWKLPVIYVIENNQYAMGTSIERSSAKPSSGGAAPPSAFPARRSTAWTCWR
jgi:pyruvate dehydrogenase E1 component alpha subunit